MPYDKIWIGVLCMMCGRPILHLTDTEWEDQARLTTQKGFGKQSRFGLSCPKCDKLCDYQSEQLVRFRVQQI
jgi:hypothetical protein